MAREARALCVEEMRTPDGHGRLELTKSHRPAAVSAGPTDAPPNALGIRNAKPEENSPKTSGAGGHGGHHGHGHHH